MYTLCDKKHHWPACCLLFCIALPRCHPQVPSVLPPQVHQVRWDGISGGGGLGGLPVAGSLG